MTDDRVRRWPVPAEAGAELPAGLVLLDDPRSLWGPTLQHPGCGATADVLIGLDCAYCPSCGLNIRLDGAWVIAQLDSRPE